MTSQSGYIKVVELLLNRGSGVNDKDSDGYKALMLKNGHQEVVDLLLNKGADIKCRTKNGFTV